MPVVDNGRRIELASRPSKTPGRWRNRSYASGLSPGADIAVCGPVERAKLEADLALVREHFGLNISRAFRLALHLTANAIRKNRAMPEV